MADADESKKQKAFQTVNLPETMTIHDQDCSTAVSDFDPNSSSCRPTGESTVIEENCESEDYTDIGLWQRAEINIKDRLHFLKSHSLNFN